MKLTVFLLFSTLLCFHSFGQSAKKKNRQLKAQFAREQQKQDSAYAVFMQADKKSDSIQKMLDKKISRMTDAERAASIVYSDGTALENKLITLGVDPNVLIHYDSQIERIPKYLGEVRQVKEAMRTEVKFNKVSGNLTLDGLKVKEQNALLQEKVSAYQAQSETNKMRQKELNEQNAKLLTYYSPKLDSLTATYGVYKEVLMLKKTKLQERLDALRTYYAQKGPKGFPEVYKTVFPDVFTTPKDQVIRHRNDEPFESAGYMGYDVPPPAPKEDQKPGGSEIYTIVDEQASFPGGLEAMKAYFVKNLRYPESAKEAAISGKVFVKFVVSEQGAISDAKVMKGISGCKECDLEAIRAVKGMPKWIPAKINGQAVKAYYNLPVNFVTQ